MLIILLIYFNFVFDILAEAVCCKDHLHCCPNGYTCDTEHSRCQKGFKESHDTTCPGGMFNN
jgi:hypothetical protein